MNSLKRWLLGAAALLLASAALAEVTVSGVKFQDTTELRTLQHLQKAGNVSAVR